MNNNKKENIYSDYLKEYGIDNNTIEKYDVNDEKDVKIINDRINILKSKIAIYTSEYSNNNRNLEKNTLRMKNLTNDLSNKIIMECKQPNLSDTITPIRLDVEKENIVKKKLIDECYKITYDLQCANLEISTLRKKLSQKN
jgi:hypothetical protein